MPHCSYMLSTHRLIYRVGVSHLGGRQQCSQLQCCPGALLGCGHRARTDLGAARAQRSCTAALVWAVILRISSMECLKREVACTHRYIL